MTHLPAGSNPDSSPTLDPTLSSNVTGSSTTSPLTAVTQPERLTTAPATDPSISHNLQLADEVPAGEALDPGEVSEAASAGDGLAIVDAPAPADGVGADGSAAGRQAVAEVAYPADAGARFSAAPYVSAADGAEIAGDEVGIDSMVPADGRPAGDVPAAGDLGEDRVLYDADHVDVVSGPPFAFGVLVDAMDADQRSDASGFAEADRSQTDVAAASEDLDDVSGAVEAPTSDSSSAEDPQGSDGEPSNSSNGSPFHQQTNMSTNYSTDAGGVVQAESADGADGDLADPDRLRAAVEAVLLVVDVPTSATQLAQVLRRSVGEVETALRGLRDEYDAGDRGLDLREVADGWRLFSRDEYAAYVERFVLDGQQARLTQAALETLAVIAYRQPVTRSRISAIRGVSVDAVMRTLITRGLVEECGADPDTGGGLYQTTRLFLEKLGLRSLEELPSLAPLLPDTSQLDDVAIST